MGNSGGRDMLAFLGVPPDPRLLREDMANLPAAEQHPEPPIATHKHDRLVRAGSLLTAATLVGGILLTIYAGWRLLFAGGGALDAVLAALGVLLVATHWGWVHLAEYAGLTIDARAQRAVDERERRWLAAIRPYPRYSVTTSVLDDASISVRRVLHRPVLTGSGSFTFVQEADGEQTYDPDTSAEVIAEAVETLRRKSRLDTARLEGQWQAASAAYDAALFSADDDQQQLAARRAAATALSDHINASLLEPPLVE